MKKTNRLSSLFPFLGLTAPFSGVARHRKDTAHLNAALDSFFAQIDFETEAESLKPENVETAKNAFKTFLRDMEWSAVEYSFDELLTEKSGDHATRKNPDVPNWYHEFRQILPVLSMMRSGIYTHQNLDAQGGIEAFLVAKLRHDSYEDYGKTPTALYAALEKSAHQKNEQGELSDDKLLMVRNQYALASEVVKLVSKKTKMNYIDEEGALQTREQDFYKQDSNQFYLNMLRHYFAFELKMGDSIEGVSTRYYEAQFFDHKGGLTIDKNLKYAREKRNLYAHIAMDEMAIEKWPDMEPAIKSLDSMLGINMTIFEIINNYYDPAQSLNARYAQPMRIKQYLDEALDAYEHVPKGFRPDHIQIENLENIARKEIECGTFKMAEILEHAIYPAMIPLIGDRRGSLLEPLEEAPDYRRDNFTPL